MKRSERVSLVDLQTHHYIRSQESRRWAKSSDLQQTRKHTSSDFLASLAASSTSMPSRASSPASVCLILLSCLSDVAGLLSVVFLSSARQQKEPLLLGLLAEIFPIAWPEKHCRLVAELWQPWCACKGWPGRVVCAVPKAWRERLPELTWLHEVIFPTGINLGCNQDAGIF